MDKPRRPHVVRIWTVERTKLLYRPPQPGKLHGGSRKEPLFLWTGLRRKVNSGTPKGKGSSLRAFGFSLCPTACKRL
jgi:hypothetical protein